MNKENKLKQKKKCPRCNKVKRIKCFVYNRVLKIEVCKMCNRSVGNNKFYIPFQERKKYVISKYGLSNQEKNLMISKAMHQGMDFQNACRKVNNEISGLKTMKRIKYQQIREAYSKKKNEINQNKDKQKEFLGGLNLK